MRREFLRPDGQGRVPLAALGFDDEVVVAEEVEPGKWMLTSAQHLDPAEEAAADDAGGRPTDPARAEEKDTAFTPPPAATVTHGRSVPRMKGPASPPPGSRRSS